MEPDTRDTIAQTVPYAELHSTWYSEYIVPAGGGTYAP